MMNTKRVLDEEKVKDFVGNFLKIWQKSIEKNAEKINARRERFRTKYTEILQKMNVDVDTTMETESRSIIDMEDKLRKVEENF